MSDRRSDGDRRMGVSLMACRMCARSRSRASHILTKRVIFIGVIGVIDVRGVMGRSGEEQCAASRYSRNMGLSNA